MWRVSPVAGQGQSSAYQQWSPSLQPGVALVQVSPTMRPATPPPVQLDASGRPVGGRTLSLSPVPFMHGSRASSPTPPIRSSSPSNLPPSGGGGSSRGGGGGGGGGHLEAKVKALQAELDEANASNKIKDAQIETAEHRCAAAVGERDSARRQLAEQQADLQIMAKRIEDMEVEALREQNMRDAGERAVRGVSDFDSVVGADSAGTQGDDRVLVANAQLDKEIFKRTTAQQQLKDAEAKIRILSSQLADAKVEIDKAQRQGGAAGASPLGDGYVEVHAGDDGLHQVCAEFENGVAAGADEVVNNELKSAREQISRMTKEAEKSHELLREVVTKNVMLETEIAAAEANLSHARSRLVVLEGMVGEGGRGGVATVQSANVVGGEGAEARVKAAEARAEEAEARAEGLDLRVEEMGAALEKNSKELENISTSLENLQGERDALSASLLVSEASLKKLEGSMGDSSTALDMAVNERDAGRAALDLACRERDEARVALSAVIKDRDSARGALGASQAELESLSKRIIPSLEAALVNVEASVSEALTAALAASSQREGSPALIAQQQQQNGVELSKAMEKEIAVIKAGHAQVVEALSAECSRLGQQCREAESAVKKAMEAVEEAEAKRVEAQEAQGAADDRSRSLEREIAGLRQLLEAARVSGDVRDAQLRKRAEEAERRAEKLAEERDEAVKSKIDVLEGSKGEEESLRKSLEAAYEEEHKLRARLGEMEGEAARASELRERVVELEGQMWARNGEVETLKGRVSELEERLKARDAETAEVRSQLKKAEDGLAEKERALHDSQENLREKSRLNDELMQQRARLSEELERARLGEGGLSEELGRSRQLDEVERRLAEVQDELDAERRAREEAERAFSAMQREQELAIMGGEDVGSAEGRDEGGVPWQFRNQMEKSEMELELANRQVKHMEKVCSQLEGEKQRLHRKVESMSGQIAEERRGSSIKIERLSQQLDVAQSEVIALNAQARVLMSQVSSAAHREAEMGRVPNGYNADAAASRGWVDADGDRRALQVQLNEVKAQYVSERNQLHRQLQEANSNLARAAESLNDAARESQKAQEDNQLLQARLMDTTSNWESDRARAEELEVVQHGQEHQIRDLRLLVASKDARLAELESQISRVMHSMSPPSANRPPAPPLSASPASRRGGAPLYMSASPDRYRDGRSHSPPPVRSASPSQQRWSTPTGRETSPQQGGSAYSRPGSRDGRESDMAVLRNAHGEVGVASVRVLSPLKSALAETLWD